MIMTTLFMGCNSSLEPEESALDGGTKIAHVRVNIGNNARTILPALENGFSKFMLSAEPDGDNTATAPLPVELTNQSGTIDLSYGDWIITATAYITIAGADYAAAWGSVPITVENIFIELNLNVNTPKPGGTGTFNYAVRYPTGGTASIQLEPWPLDQNSTAGIDEDINGDKSHNVPSGVYFMTVTATANGRTVNRNNIVHIYDQAPTNVNYAFTKLDFGDTSLILSGTVKVLVNGVQPSAANLWYSTDQNNWNQSPITFSGTNGSGAWSIALSNIGGAATLYVRAGPFDNMTKNIPSIPIPYEDTPGIDLGTAELTVTSFSSNTWVSGNITMPCAEDWYSINLTAGTRYYFWWNGRTYGDGSKTLVGQFAAYDNNGNSIFGSGNAWAFPFQYIAISSGTIYIRVRADDGNDTGTYAIGYSTDSLWHNNPFDPVNPASLSANAWRNSNITTPNVDDWYSITVTAGTVYYFWFNQKNYGDSSKTLEGGQFVIYDDNGSEIGNGYNVWSTSAQFAFSYSGVVYVKVSGFGNTGSYGIAYRTTNSRP